MQTPDSYYTAAQAAEKLGVDIRQLLVWANNGAIVRIIPPGNRKRGVYLKSSIDEFAEKRAAFFNTDNKDAKKKIA